MKAIVFILPSWGRFMKFTPICSNLSHALFTSGTITPMWPYPLGSELPTWYLKFGSSSVPQLLEIQKVTKNTRGNKQTNIFFRKSEVRTVLTLKLPFDPSTRCFFRKSPAPPWNPWGLQNPWNKVKTSFLGSLIFGAASFQGLQCRMEGISSGLWCGTWFVEK